MHQYFGRDAGNLEAIIDNHLLTWIDQVHKNWVSQSNDSPKVDIGRQIQLLTVDVISNVSLGESFDCVKNNIDKYDFLATIQQAVKASQLFSALDELGILFYYATRIPLVRRVLLPSVADQKGLGKIMGVRQTSCLYCFRANFPVQLAEKAIEEISESRNIPEKSLLNSFLKRGVARDQIATEIVVSL